MDYEYQGYLATILYAPDPEAYTQVDHIDFTADDIMKWTTRDQPWEKQWQKIPPLRKRNGDAVQFTARFHDEPRIDVLPAGDFGFWAPLGTIGAKDKRFPLDLRRYPAFEITYRCATENAALGIAWSYPGGLNVQKLPRTMKWRTVVLRAQHFGFPVQLNDFVIRLYSSARTTESAEIKSVRFRGLTKSELEACYKDETRLKDRDKAAPYAVLDDFIPLGCVLNAETARRMAAMLGIGLAEYWTFALRDIAAHHHNCIMLEEYQRLTEAEWRALLAMLPDFGLRIVPVQHTLPNDDPAYIDEMLATWVKPYADEPAILSWMLMDEPREADFARVLALKAKVKEADPNHPMAVVTRHPSAYPLLAPFFAASGINYYASHAPWNIGELVRNHVGLGPAQQFWLMGPGFTWATGTPEWNSCPELRIMVNSAFANGARGWFTFAYHNDPIWVTGSCMRSLAGPFLAFSDLWLEMDRCMERISVLAPLLHKTWPWHLPKHWYAWSARSGDHYEFPEGVSPTTSYRLRGPDYNLYFIISNDIRGMATVNMDIPRDAMRGLAIYDVSDFLTSYEWKPMSLERHLQMVPGQARILLVAEESVCGYWRDILAGRMIVNLKRAAALNFPMCEAYRVDTSAIRALVDLPPTGDPLAELHNLDRAYHDMQNRIYAVDAATRARSSIVEAMAAACACDGALCRLVKRGRLEEARTLGEEVIPLAREFTHLRIDLEAGHAERILPHCEDLSNRVNQLLKRIRAAI